MDRHSFFHVLQVKFKDYGLYKELYIFFVIYYFIMLTFLLHCETKPMLSLLFLYVFFQTHNQEMNQYKFQLRISLYKYLCKLKLLYSFQSSISIKSSMYIVYKFKLNWLIDVSFVINSYVNKIIYTQLKIFIHCGFFFVIA